MAEQLKYTVTYERSERNDSGRWVRKEWKKSIFSGKDAERAAKLHVSDYRATCQKEFFKFPSTSDWRGFTAYNGGIERVRVDTAITREEAPGVYTQPEVDTAFGGGNLSRVGISPVELSKPASNHPTLQRESIWNDWGPYTDPDQFFPDGEYDITTYWGTKRIKLSSQVDPPFNAKRVDVMLLSDDGMSVSWVPVGVYRWDLNRAKASPFLRNDFAPVVEMTMSAMRDPANVKRDMRGVPVIIDGAKVLPDNHPKRARTSEMCAED